MIVFILGFFINMFVLEFLMHKNRYKKLVNMKSSILISYQNMI